MEQFDRLPASACRSWKVFLLEIPMGMPVAMSPAVLLLIPTAGVTTNETVIEGKVAGG
jgi:ABC-type uncharacterized transport system ATPase subunit